jgi:ubiquinone/menaquinone biosynthesis C-methylase UbiE
MKKPSQQSTYMFDINDGRELARLGLQDNLFNAIIPRFPAQFIPHGQDQVLDVACGPGGWALQAIQDYPRLSITGVDISPHMIQYARAQAEVRKLDAQFRMMDIGKIPWDFPDEHFDFVNARFVTGAVSTSAWNSFLQECWRVLKPGGVFRSVEAVYMSAPTCPAIQKIIQLTLAVMHKIGITYSSNDMAVSPIVSQILKHVGFDDLVAVPYMVDLSCEAPLHYSMGENLKMASNLLKPLIIRFEGISFEELEKLYQEWDQEWNAPSFYCHWHLCGVSGVKTSN